ncbi:MAG: DUF4011 domain-containing protein [Elusimicrobia bacterium]|nr:DUF4011 domain-containing protein [Elusimicrobiota bacterium]
MKRNPEQQLIVDRARIAWMKRLIDTSRRNNLLYYRDLRIGTLNLENYNKKLLEDLISGEKVSLGNLLQQKDKTEIAARIREIRRRAQSNLEERGLETLFLAAGMATWHASDEGRPPEAPIVLVPLKIEPLGREGREISIQRAGDDQINSALLHILEDDFNVSISQEDLLPDSEDEQEALNLEFIYRELGSRTSKIPEFSIKPRVVIGNFSFQKMSMVNDIKKYANQLGQHELVAAIAGYGPSREILQRERVEISVEEIDKAKPVDDLGVLDADASQQRAILAALKGQHGVIHGPPGTGKSQTIANLIAVLAAQGKKVLFVAQKRAALEVVKDRLKQAGLGHLVLDVHGADVSRRELMAKVAETISQLKNSSSVDADELYARYKNRRSRLNKHVEVMHQPRLPSGLSVHQMQGRLLRLPSGAQNPVRWRGKMLDRLTHESVNEIHDLLREASGFEGLFLRKNASPWTGANLEDGKQAQEALDLATTLSTKLIPTFLSTFKEISSTTKLLSPKNLSTAMEQSRLLEDVAQTLILYNNELFQEDFDKIMEILRPARANFLSVFFSWCLNKEFRLMRNRLRLLRRAGPVSIAQFYKEINQAAKQKSRWMAVASGSLPSISEKRVELSDLLRQLYENLKQLNGYLCRNGLPEVDLETLISLTARLSGDRITPHRIPQLLGIEKQLVDHGIDELINYLRAGANIDGEFWVNSFDFAWISSCLEKAQFEDKEIAGFNGRIHDKLVQDFQQCDRERLQIARMQVHRSHAEQVFKVMNNYPDQANLIKREISKSKRQLPLRTLLQRAGDVLLSISPCWMASPLSVSNLLDGEKTYFDVVLFDEASQILPEDAIPSILRAKTTIVAGDRDQLPPTSFFVAGENEEDSTEEMSDPTEGFESILDVLSSFLDLWSLDWHYRSFDEVLIQFSNRHIYGKRLLTFPNPKLSEVLTHKLIPFNSEHDEAEESSAEEVREVVRLVIQHAKDRPRESLGVITMGIKHMRRIEAALDEELPRHEGLDEFFDPNRKERFFVKNIERVQGDERDAIIISVGYGKDRTGRLLYRFGPLLFDGGHRRLNVAVTRARRRLTLVSSFTHVDMDPQKCRSLGVKLLREYIAYAISGGKFIDEEIQAGIPLNDFERDVFESLESKGLKLVPQLGTSRYRLDMAVQHPEQPGRFILAIECDGATYHSAQSARDRDRLRQQHLEALGWRFHRIWSTDWFTRKSDEIERTMAAFKNAVSFSDSIDARGELHSSDHIMESPPIITSASNAITKRSGTKPKLPIRASINDYSNQELTQLVKWILSDGRLYTDEELIEEAMKSLPFERRGNRIEEKLTRIIRKIRNSKA